MILPAVLVACAVKRKDKIADDAVKTYEHLLKDSTTVEVIDKEFNFGKVSDGEKVEFNYRFKNTGTKPLVVTGTSASCGCTIPEKPEQPILPGATGFIKIVFNSKGRVGTAHKTITVTANTIPPFPELLLTGEVIKTAENKQ